MSCTQHERDLQLHADGELAGSGSLELLTHLQACPECARKVFAIQQLRASIGRTMGEMKAPAALHASIASLLAAESEKRGPEARPAAAPRVYKLHWPAAIAAAVGLALVGVWQLAPWKQREVVDYAALIQPVNVTDNGPVATSLATNIRALHVRCAMMGPGHHDPSLPRKAQDAADQLSTRLGLAVMSGSSLRLASGVPTFEGANVCSLVDAENVAHQVAHLLYRDASQQAISIMSMAPFAELTGLKTRAYNHQNYSVLAPGSSTSCHPFTIVAWSSRQASYVISVPFDDEEAMQYVEPIRVALEREPSIEKLFLAALQ